MMPIVVIVITVLFITLGGIFYLGIGLILFIGTVIFIVIYANTKNRFNK